MSWLMPGDCEVTWVTLMLRVNLSLTDPDTVLPSAKHVSRELVWGEGDGRCRWRERNTHGDEGWMGM